jgi:L-lysine 2,3-aminomutase
MKNKMKNKRVVVCSVECPFCLKQVDVLKEEETITPAQKAEKEVRYFAEKSTQKTLDGS